MIGFYEFYGSGVIGELMYVLSLVVWGYGYVVEVGNCLMYYGFEMLNYEIIEVYYVSVNFNFGWVMVKMGM